MVLSLSYTGVSLKSCGPGTEDFRSAPSDFNAKVQTVDLQHPIHLCLILSSPTAGGSNHVKDDKDESSVMGTHL